MATCPTSCVSYLKHFLKPIVGDHFGVKVNVQEGRSQAVSVIEALFGAEFIYLESGFTQSSPYTFSVYLEIVRDGCSWAMPPALSSEHK